MNLNYVYSLWPRKLLTWAGAWGWQDVTCWPERSSIEAAFKVSRRGRCQEVGTWLLSPLKPPDSQFWKGDIHVMQYWFAELTILKCSAKSFFTWNTETEHEVLRKCKPPKISTQASGKVLYYLYVVARIVSGGSIFRVFYSNWIVPEVVPRGSSNAVCFQGFSVSESLQIQPITWSCRWKQRRKPSIFTFACY